MTISTLHELIRVLLTTKWEGNRSRITYVWFLTPYNWLLTRPSTRQGIENIFSLKVYWSLDDWIKQLQNEKITTKPLIIPRREETNLLISNYTTSNASLTSQNYKVNFCVRVSLHLFKTRWEIFFILRQLKVINPLNSCHLYLCTDNTGKLDADWFIWYDLS